MFSILGEEFLSTIPATEAQRRRVERALTEQASYQFEDASDDYNEAACRVTTPNGRYLCFPNQCTCPDWTHRGPMGKGEIEACKHIIAVECDGMFMEPANPAPAPFTPEPVPTSPMSLATGFPTEEEIIEMERSGELYEDSDEEPNYPDPSDEELCRRLSIWARPLSRRDKGAYGLHEAVCYTADGGQFYGGGCSRAAAIARAQFNATAGRAVAL